MRLMVLSVMGLIAGLGLAWAIGAVPVMAEKGPLRATLVAHLGGAQQEEVQGGGDPDGRGRAVVKVFKEQLCAGVKTAAIETSLTKATLHLGMSGEQGPPVANLEERAATPTGTTTGTTTPTTGTTTGTTTPTTGTTTTTGTTGAQTGTTTTTGDTTMPQATTGQSTTVGQTSPSQSTASPTASASAASASAASASASVSAATSFEHTGGCVAVPRALSLELLEHPRRFYVNVSNGQSAEGAIRGQLHRSGHDDHRSGDGDDD
jgi:hypothetical protein